jgi:hypothetical protein
LERRGRGDRRGRPRLDAIYLIELTPAIIKRAGAADPPALRSTARRAARSMTPPTSERVNDCERDASRRSLLEIERAFSFGNSARCAKIHSPDYSRSGGAIAARETFR